MQGERIKGSVMALVPVVGRVRRRGGVVKWWNGGTEYPAIAF